MRIATWNVNSLKARLERVEEWLEYARPDVLCLQETKAMPHQLPPELRRQALSGILDSQDKALQLLRGRVFSQGQAHWLEQQLRASEEPEIKEEEDRAAVRQTK